MIPPEACTTFQAAKMHTRMLKFRQYYFIASTSFEKVNPDKIRSKGYRHINIDGIEKKLTRFQIYPETEVACKYETPIYKTQYTEILFEYEKYFDMKTGSLIINPTQTYKIHDDENSYITVTFLKTTGNTSGKVCPQNKEPTFTGDITNEQYLLWRIPLLHPDRYEIRLQNKQSFLRNIIIRTRNTSTFM